MFLGGLTLLSPLAFRASPSALTIGAQIPFCPSPFLHQSETPMSCHAPRFSYSVHLLLLPHSKILSITKLFCLLHLLAQMGVWLFPKDTVSRVALSRCDYWSDALLILGIRVMCLLGPHCCFQTLPLSLVFNLIILCPQRFLTMSFLTAVTFRSLDYLVSLLRDFSSRLTVILSNTIPVFISIYM